MMRTIARLTLIALVLLLLAGVLIAAHDVSAGGGGGYCNPLYLRLGGCQPRVTCDIGHPIIDEDETGYVLKCQYDPQAPEADNGLLTLLEPGQRVKVGCAAPLSIYAIHDGDSWLVVGCHD